MIEDKGFIIGETVHLRSRVSLAGTNVPTDPDDVRLVALIHSNPPEEGAGVVLEDVVLSQVKTGEYELVVQTADLAPGVYRYEIRHSSGAGPDRVAIERDEFVLTT